MQRSLAVALLAPVVLAACAREPEPAPAPVMSAAEQACADRAASLAAVDPTAVSVVSTATTKSGATIYTASAGGVDYTCVVEVDLTISQFAAL